MSVKSLNEWNVINGLSPLLIKNIIVGIIIMLASGWAWAEWRCDRANERAYQSQEARIEDQKQSNLRLLREREIRDSLQQVYKMAWYKMQNK